jgi:hypothetical protein
VPRTGLSPATAELSRTFRYQRDFSLPASPAELAERSHDPRHATTAVFNT